MTAGNIFVTGGMGYIGSHMVVLLLEQGYEVTIFDNLSNSSENAYPRLQYIAGDKAANMKFIKGDIRSMDDLHKAFNGVKYEAVIHFAGRKFVGESVSEPFLYYDINMRGTTNLIEVMAQHGCKNLVFSSSCTVYGNPEYVPLDEKHRVKAVSPYGRTKLMIEEMLQDISAADPEWRIIALRYFNPVGAHSSGLIGEEPKGIPNNLMPFVQQVAEGQRPFLSVFGSDYDTRDGTCIRDYVHVVDLVEGHVAAMKKLFGTSDIKYTVYNLGTGVGTTVLELVQAFEKASGIKVAYKLVDRRPGDAQAVWAATDVCEKELGWKATRNIDDMCRDVWRWSKLNPEGLATPLDRVLAMAHEE